MCKRIGCKRKITRKVNGKFALCSKCFKAYQELMAIYD